MQSIAKPSDRHLPQLPEKNPHRISPARNSRIGTSQAMAQRTKCGRRLQREINGRVASKNATKISQNFTLKRNLRIKARDTTKTHPGFQEVLFR